MSERSIAQATKASTPAVTSAPARVLQRQCDCGEHTNGGECESCREEHGGTLQRAAINSNPIGSVPPVVHEVLRSPGQPLDPATRAFFEPRFGHDFSGVRVHTDAAAAASARALKAHAYTAGDDIVLAAGRFTPQAAQDRHVLAHELTHVVQQSRGGASPALEPHAPHEQEADEAARLLVEGRAPVAVGSTAVGVARQAGPEPVLEPLGPQELLRFLLSIRAFATSSPGVPAFDPKGIGTPTGKGYQTYAAIQVLDAKGTPVKVSIGGYLGRGSPHGEEAAIAALRQSIPASVNLKGGSMIVAVEQVPCAGCDSAIEHAAQEMGLSHYEVYVPSRESLTAPGTGTLVKPKTGATSAFQGGRPPTEARRVIGKSLSPIPSAPGPSTSAAGSSLPPESPPAGRVAPPEASPVNRPTVPAEPASVARPAPEPIVSPEAPRVTPEPLVPEAGTAPKSSGPGVFGGLFGFAFPLAAGLIHQRAVAREVAERVKKEGYVPPDAQSNEGFLYRLGSWFIDPLNDATRTIPSAQRFNFQVWRSRLRELANSKNPGATLTARWEITTCSFDIFGRRVVEMRNLVYEKRADRSWFVKSGNATGTPDLNDIVSTSVPDASIEAIVSSDPCSA